MSKQKLLPAVLSALLLLPTHAFAYIVQIDTGVHSTIPRVMAGFVNVLLKWSGIIATGLFLLGCVLMIGSGGDDQLLSAGKRIMKSTLIGFALVLASWMLLSTVVYFIAG